MFWDSSADGGRIPRDKWVAIPQLEEASGAFDDVAGRGDFHQLKLQGAEGIVGQVIVPIFGKGGTLNEHGFPTTRIRNLRIDVLAASPVQIAFGLVASPGVCGGCLSARCRLLLARRLLTRLGLHASPTQP